MKIILALVTLFSLNIFAGETNYEVSADRACVLQIMKESPATLVETCAAKTYLNLDITPFSRMAQPGVFQSAMIQTFIQKLHSAVPVTCQEWDNSTALIVICQGK